MSERIPDFFLEQYRLGEADEETVERIENDRHAMERVRELERSDSEHFEKYPAGWFVDQVRQRAAEESRSTERAGSDPESVSGAFWGRVLRGFQAHPALVPAIAAAVLVLALLPLQFSSNPGVAENPDELAGGERVKGLEPALAVFRSADAGSVEELDDNAAVRAGDRLQIAYNAAGVGYGAIFSVDGNGVLTLHYPESALQSAALEQGGTVALPYSYILDDAPRYERFFFVYGPDDFDIGRLVDDAEAVADDAGAVRTVVDRWVSAEDGRGVQEITLQKGGR